MRTTALFLVCALAASSALAQRATTVSASIRVARDVKVAAQVAGVVVARPVARNSRVKRGDPILIVDSRFQKLAVQRAKAACDKAGSDFDWADKELERELKLQAGSSTSDSQLHLLRKTKDAAAAALAIQRVVLQEAQETLERCTVRAPEAGVLGEIWPEIGESVTLFSPVARLLTDHELVAESFLSPEEIVRVRPGATLTVMVDLPKATTLQGKVIERATVANNRTYRVRVAIPSPPAGLLAGFAARIVLPELR